MKKTSSLLILILISSIFEVVYPVNAAGTSISNIYDGPTYWIKTYSILGRSSVNDIKISKDGDIIAVGMVYSSTRSWDAFVMKLSSSGEVEWSRTYGGKSVDVFTAIAIADNGDIIVAGSTESFGSGERDIWVLRLDENGNVKWQKTYGGSKDDGAISITTYKGDIIVLGHTDSSKSRSWILRLDKNGDLKWSKTYGGLGSEFWDVAIAHNGDMFVVGSKLIDADNQDAWLLRLDENGNIKWQKTFGGNGVDVASSVVILGNELIVAGMRDIKEFNSTVFAWDMGYLWVSKLDENGNIKWERVYKGDHPNRVYFSFLTPDIIGTPNGDIVLAGYTTGKSSKEDDIWLLRLDNSGNIRWQIAIGGNKEDVPKAIALIPDGSIVIGGIYNASDFYLRHRDGDAALLKLPGNGNISGCSICRYTNAKIYSVYSEVRTPKINVDVTGFLETSTSNLSTTASLGKVIKTNVTASIVNVTVQAQCRDSDKWARTYGKFWSSKISDMKVSPDGSIIAVGSMISSRDGVVMKISSSGDIIWWKTYGGIENDDATGVALTPNGDIIVVGYTNNTKTNGYDVWVLRLDENGNIKWQKTFGGDGDDKAHAVALTPNGDIIVAGYTNSFGAGGYDGWILRLDGEGNIKWQKTYGGNGSDEVSTIVLASNGDIIVAGYTESFGAGGKDIWILRLDKNGNVKWQKTYGGSNDDDASALAVTPSEDIIVTGSTTSFSAGGWDAWVLRLDSEGNVEWQRTYGKEGNEWGRALAIADNGDIVIAGDKLNFAHKVNTVWILRLDPRGDLIWQKSYPGHPLEVFVFIRTISIFNGDVLVGGLFRYFGLGYNYPSASLVWCLDKNGNIKWRGRFGGPSVFGYGSSSEEARSTVVAPNGDIIVVGYIGRFNDDIDAWILRLDGEGNIKWQKTYGGYDLDVASSVVIAPDGDIIVAGYTYSFGAGGEDIWILRLDKNGNVKWQKTYGGNESDGWVDVNVAIASNGDIIVVSSTRSFGAGDYDAWVLRLDDNGNVKWQKTYGGRDRDWASAVAIVPNGDIIVAGLTQSLITKTNKAYSWVLRLDENGNVKWQKKYYGNYRSSPNSVVVSPEGNIVIVGFIMMKLDKNGEVLWAKIFGADATGTVTPEGDVIVGRALYVNYGTLADTYLFCLDTNGNIKWVRGYGSKHTDDVINAVTFTMENNLVLVGRACGSWQCDIWVLKTDHKGDIPNCTLCSEVSGTIEKMTPKDIIIERKSLIIPKSFTPVTKILWKTKRSVVIDNIQFYLLTPWDTPDVINLQELPPSRTLEFEIWLKSHTGGTAVGSILITLPNATTIELPVNITIKQNEPTIVYVPWKLPNNIIPGTYAAVLLLYSPSDLHNPIAMSTDAFYFEDPDRSYVQVLVLPDGKKIVHMHLQRYSFGSPEFIPSYVEFLKLLDFDIVNLGQGAIEVIKQKVKGVVTPTHPIDKTLVFEANSSNGTYIAYLSDTYPLDVLKKEIREATITLLLITVSLVSGPIADILEALSSPTFLSIPAKLGSKVVVVSKDAYDSIPSTSTYYELHPPVEMKAELISPLSPKMFVGKTYELKMQYLDPRNNKFIDRNITFKLALIKEKDNTKIPLEAHVIRLSDGETYSISFKIPGTLEPGDYTLAILAYARGYYSETYRTIKLEISNSSSQNSRSSQNSICGPGIFIAVFILLAAIAKLRKL
ncbi:NHL repeat-containing protein [Thermococcus sp.]